MLKPNVVDKLGEILKRIISCNFHIANIKMVKLTKEEATEVFKDQDNTNIA